LSKYKDEKEVNLSKQEGEHEGKQEVNLKREIPLSKILQKRLKRKMI